MVTLFNLSRVLLFESTIHARAIISEVKMKGYGFASKFDMEYKHSNFEVFQPHKVIKTADGTNIVLQDLDQDLEQHQVGLVANQGTGATMTYSRVAPNQGAGATCTSDTCCAHGVVANQGISATSTGNSDNGGNAMYQVQREQNPKVQLPSLLAGLTSEDEPCFVNSKQYKR